MSVAYFDASALVKLYADEPSHQEVRSLDAIIVTSSLARVEVVSAFFGKVRINELSTANAQILTDVFTSDWNDGRFVPISPNEEIEVAAAALVIRYPLRGFDALHLATANAARRASGDCEVFVCFDKKLNTAAAGEQFKLMTV